VCERRLPRANGARSARSHHREPLPPLRHSDEIIWYGGQGHSIIGRPFGQLPTRHRRWSWARDGLCATTATRAGCARRKVAAQDTAATETPINRPPAWIQSSSSTLGPQRRFTGTRCAPATFADNIELCQLAPDHVVPRRN
jgi:hypothetical protein